MSRWLVRHRSAVIVGLGLAIAACTAQPGASPVPSSAASASSAVASPPGATPAPPTLTPATSAPPMAALTVEGGDPVVGQLGSFTWGGGGSDSPWLPGAPLEVGAGEPITVSLEPETPVTEWTASRVDAGVTDGTGAVSLGAGSGPIVFTSPEAETGTWSVLVDVRFGDDLGSAAYYWRLTVR
jgi:hypothetical protein